MGLAVKRKAIATARFYYFDTGVKNRLAGIHAIPEATDLFSQAFEHFIVMELRAYISYTRKKLPLNFWRTSTGHEVDFIVANQVAIAVKSIKKVSKKHLKSLNYLMEENKIKSYYLVSQDPIALKKAKIYILPWMDFLKRLWDGDIF